MAVATVQRPVERTPAKAISQVRVVPVLARDADGEQAMRERAWTERYWDCQYAKWW